MKYKSNSGQDTQKLAQKIAQGLQGGEVLALSGDLGAGKTTFAQGLAKALKVKDNVNSPTFVIMKVYSAHKGKIKYFVHVDAYRLSNEDELKAIGIEDYLGRSDVVVVIEWAEKVQDILPKQTKNIIFQHQDKEKRIIIIQ